jgi:hypothetical protein
MVTRKQVACQNPFRQSDDLAAFVVFSESDSPAVVIPGIDAALESLYCALPQTISSLSRVRENVLRTNTLPAKVVPALDCGVPGAESTNVQRSVRGTDDSRGARTIRRHVTVDDLFAQWESDPLQLQNVPGRGN